jgi:hypothetical protein
MRLAVLPHGLEAVGTTMQDCAHVSAGCKHRGRGDSVIFTSRKVTAELDRSNLRSLMNTGQSEIIPGTALG